jgi:hypothetical protein
MGSCGRVNKCSVGSVDRAGAAAGVAGRRLSHRDDDAPIPLMPLPTPLCPLLDSRRAASRRRVPPQVMARSTVRRPVSLRLALARRWRALICNPGLCSPALSVALAEGWAIQRRRRDLSFS